MGFGIGNTMGFIFPIFFIVVAAFIIFTFVRGARQWFHNNSQPRIPAEARVVSKRIDVDYSQSSSDDIGTTSTTYYIMFEFMSGDRMEYRVPRREFDGISEGDSGILTSQGTRYISFE